MEYLRMTRSLNRCSALLILFLVPVTSSADEPYCQISSDEVVAGTSEQGGTLDSAECTKSFRRFVNETVAEVRRSYEPFLEALRADPKMIDALSRLIAREDLLSTGWMSLSESSVSHAPSASDSRLLQETSTLLQELLTQEDFRSLQRYKRSLPTRELLRPVIDRLRLAGVPPSAEQLERAVNDVQIWAAGLMDRSGEDGADDSSTCEQRNTLVNRREAEIVAVLLESLDEKQSEVVRAYYRERAEQREQELVDYRARTGNAPCMIRQF
jgi:hypothetical protein